MDARKTLLQWRRADARRTPRAPDPADMGTAFAMEYVLDQDAQHRDPTADAPTPRRREASRWFKRWWGAKPAL